MIRILFTGSRDLPQCYRPTVERIVRSCPTGSTLVHGGCYRGLDSDVDLFGRIHGYTVEVHPAEWQKYGKSAGMLRNGYMVSLGATFCVAVYYGRETPGTSDCVRKARTAGIEVREITLPWLPVEIPPLRKDV